MKNILHLDNLEFVYDETVIKTGVQKTYYTLNNTLKNYCNLYSYVSKDSNIDKNENTSINFIKSNRNSMLKDIEDKVDLKRTMYESKLEVQVIKNLIVDNNIHSVIMHNARSKFTLKKMNVLQSKIKKHHPFNFYYIVHVTPSFIGASLLTLVEAMITAALNGNTIVFVSKYCQKKWVDKIYKLNHIFEENIFSSHDFYKALNILTSDKCFIGYFYYMPDNSLVNYHDGSSVVLGRASQEKRLHLMSNYAKKKNDDVKIICSYIEDSSYYDKHILPLKNKPNVFIFLNKERKVVLEELSKSRVLVSTCKIEALGLVILEALSYGLPVIAFNDTADDSSAYELVPDICKELIISYERSERKIQLLLEEKLKLVDELYSNNPNLRADIQKYAQEKYSRAQFENSIIRAFCD